MTAFIIDGETFNMAMREADIAVISFSADWCTPCKVFGKVLEKVSSHFPTITFGILNIEEEPGIAEIYHVRSIPHLLIVKQGVLIYSESGSMPESTLRELVEQAIETDVSQLREQAKKTE